MNVERIRLFCLVVACLGAALPCQAQLFPLEVGATWTYRSVSQRNGVTEIDSVQYRVSGITTIRFEGRDLDVLLYEFVGSGHHALLRQEGDALIRYGSLLDVIYGGIRYQDTLVVRDTLFQLPGAGRPSWSLVGTATTSTRGADNIPRDVQLVQGLPKTRTVQAAPQPCGVALVRADCIVYETVHQPPYDQYRWRETQYHAPGVGRVRLEWSQGPYRSGSDELLAFTISTATETTPPELPPVLHAYPNPAAGAVTIGYHVPRAGLVRVQVYDLRGRAVASLVDAPQPAGWQQASFDAARLPSGVYLVRLTSGPHTETRPLVVQR